MRPAPPDLLAGQGGAAPSSSGGGPSGKRGVAQAAPRESLCDYCNGTFASLTDELAYYRKTKTCQSCGAGPHWEQGADKDWLADNTRAELDPEPDRRGEHLETLPLWDGMDVLWERDPRPARDLHVIANAQDIEAGDHDPLVRDIDGTLIYDLLDQHAKKNFGRMDGKSLEPNYYDSSSMFIERAGTTGRRAGRPPRGTSDQPWEQIIRLAKILVLDKPGKALIGEQLIYDHSVNVAELAKRSGLSSASLYRWTAKVRKNLPIGESMATSPPSPPTIVERVTELEQRVAATERQVGLPSGGDKAAEEAVDQLLDSCLGVRFATLPRRAG